MGNIFVEKEEEKYNILMFPWLAHGHIFPFLELAKRIITSKPNLTIHFCSTSINLHSIKPCLSKHESRSIKLVQLVLVSSQLPPEHHTTKNLPPHIFPTLLQDCRDSIPSFINIVDSIKPNILIYDLFQPWAAKYAKSRGIPCVNFITSGAAASSFYHHQYTHGAYSTNFPYKGIYLLDEENIDYMALAAGVIKDVGEGFAMGNFALSHDIVLLKSSRGLEGKYIDYLTSLCNKQIVVTGPLVTVAPAAKQQGQEREQERKLIMQWLDEKKEKSVIYVSFGSECFLSKEQMNEMANGLELCATNFIWIIRSPVGVVENELPLGFRERVKERGLILRKWAPQTSILAHSSVVGFVSHCGWSSTIESMYFGVPVIGMPMSVDQPINVRMMVEAGVGVEVVKEENGVYKGEEIAKAIGNVIGNESMRERAQCFSGKIKENEKQDIEQVAEHLMMICINK